MSGGATCALVGVGLWFALVGVVVAALIKGRWDA